MTVETVIRMPADLHEAIKQIAVDENRSMAETIRRALTIYVQTRGQVTEATDAAPRP